MQPKLSSGRHRNSNNLMLRRQCQTLMKLPSNNVKHPPSNLSPMVLIRVALVSPDLILALVLSKLLRLLALARQHLKRHCYRVWVLKLELLILGVVSRILRQVLQGQESALSPLVRVRDNQHQDYMREL